MSVKLSKLLAYKGLITDMMAMLQDRGAFDYYNDSRLLRVKNAVCSSIT